MSKTILVVDDEKSIVAMIRDVLQGEGYNVRNAYDGGQALVALGMDPANEGKPERVKLPDLVILDIMMPVVDGYTVASRMHDNAATQRVPIIVLTAKGPMRDVFESLSNVKAYLVKPFEPENLRKNVKKLLRQSGS